MAPLWPLSGLLAVLPAAALDGPDQPQAPPVEEARPIPCRPKGTPPPEAEPSEGGPREGKPPPEPAVPDCPPDSPEASRGRPGAAPPAADPAADPRRATERRSREALAGKSAARGAQELLGSLRQADGALPALSGPGGPTTSAPGAVLPAAQSDYSRTLRTTTPGSPRPERPRTSGEPWYDGVFRGAEAVLGTVANALSLHKSAPVDTSLIIMDTGDPATSGRWNAERGGDVRTRLLSAPDGGVRALTLQGHGIPGKMLVADDAKGMQELFVRDGRVMLGAGKEAQDVTELLKRKMAPGSTLFIAACNSATPGEKDPGLAAALSGALPGVKVNGYNGKAAVNQRGAEKWYTYGFKDTCTGGRCEGRGRQWVARLGEDNPLVTTAALFSLIDGNRDLLPGSPR